MESEVGVRQLAGREVRVVLRSSAFRELKDLRAVISPLLANIYLFYVLDLWTERWRRREATGDVIIVRYADDFIVGFEHEADARRFLDELRERMGTFSLALHPEKTRLIEFGRHAAASRKRQGLSHASGDRFRSHRNHQVERRCVQDDRQPDRHHHRHREAAGGIRR